jgi:hypothetical protein
LARGDAAEQGRINHDGERDCPAGLNRRVTTVR